MPPSLAVGAPIFTTHKLAEYLLPEQLYTNVSLFCCFCYFLGSWRSALLTHLTMPPFVLKLHLDAVSMLVLPGGSYVSPRKPNTLAKPGGFLQLLTHALYLSHSRNGLLNAI